MPTRKRIITASLVLVVLLGVFASTVALRRHSPLFNLIFSPSDLYRPLAVTSIDLSQENAVYKVQFQNKYPGLHWIAIEVEKPNTTVEGYSGNFVLNLEVSDRGATLVKETIKGPGSPFWGGMSRSGFAIHWFRSPNNLPLREPLTATVTVVRGDSAFQAKHGVSKLVVSKLSDE